MATSVIPGPAGMPVLGSMFDLRRAPLDTFLRARREHGDVVRFTAGPPGLRTALYAVFSADGAQRILAGESANFRKDNIFYEELRQTFGNGLLTSQDDTYRRQRRLLQPLFTPRRVEGYAEAITAEVGAVADRWRQVPGTVRDVAHDMREFALRTVARILFGSDADAEAAVPVVERDLPVLSDYVTRRGFSPLNVPRSWPTAANRRAAAARAELYAICDSVIARRRAARSAGAVAPEAAGDDLLTLLTRAEGTGADSFDADEVRDQILILMLAGHETTAVSLTFTLHLLGLHLEEQALARAEVERVLGDRTPTAADAEKLVRVTRVLKEAMRLYPAATAIGRRVVADAEFGGHLVPAGSDIVVAPWVTHRHPAYWGDDPERFDSDRFLPEAEASRPRYAWFPFGGGPRACVGQHLSLLESVLALAVVLREFEITSLDETVPVTSGVTLRAEGPVRCRVTPIPGRQHA
ncbi:cytochrome P450 [Streptomyces specialis]|uniref:cytochrome P450 n=1 Tax=Streptomyces specialis TaxID=498367 RepID=UPI00073E3D3C|nr:cytochrome P450 [Streptomyces specialis]